MRILLVALAFLGLSACSSSFSTETEAVNQSDQSSLIPPVDVVPEPEPESSGFDLFQEVADPLGQKVDRRYSSYREYQKVRAVSDFSVVDRCEAGLQGRKKFSDVVAFFVQEHFQPQRAELSFISDLFGLPSSQSAFAQNSLVSHSMCRVTAETLAQTIGSQRVPSAATIAKLNQWVDRYNVSQAKLRRGDESARKELLLQWGQLFMCLGYVESLTTADTARSQDVAKRNAPSSYRKPAGVNFYEDPKQPAASRLNIGLYQFTPDSRGNIFPCLRRWNGVRPQCALRERGTQDEMIWAVGSELQTFNAFCGVNKIVQMFSVQVNTDKPSNTHPSNNRQGRLRFSDERCVSLHFRPGNSYLHFGPLMNNTGKNLDELFTCALSP
jgi:hypothetical protein